MLKEEFSNLASRWRVCNGLTRNRHMVLMLPKKGAGPESGSCKSSCMDVGGRRSETPREKDEKPLPEQIQSDGRSFPIVRLCDEQRVKCNCNKLLWVVRPLKVGTGQGRRTRTCMARSSVAGTPCGGKADEIGLPNGGTWSVGPGLTALPPLSSVSTETSTGPRKAYRRLILGAA